MTPCVDPIPDEAMVDYWSGGLPAQRSEAIEDHVFSCAECARRLEALASIGSGISSLARKGRFAGIIARGTLNQLQRDGVRVRLYSLSPGDVVPCAVFPDDDVVVTAMRGDFAGIEAVTIQVNGLAPLPDVVIDDVPVSPAEGEVLWAAPGSLIRRLPSSRVTLRVTARDAGRLIGEYVLDHSAH